MRSIVLVSISNFVLVVLAGVALGNIKCIPITSSNLCQCKTENGTTLDISHYFNYPESVPQDGENYYYLYSPCEKIECKTGKGLVSHMCRKGNDVTFNCGSDFESWVISGTNPMKFKITYLGGDDGRYTLVTFKYENSPNEIKFSSYESSGQYNFDVTGRSVAPYTPSSSKGGGSGDKAGPIGLAIISLFIISVVAYFVIGGLINYFHRGARGAEVIPNYTFWKDVPFLIKDGFLFTISPCYKPALEKIPCSSNNNNRDYQSINSSSESHSSENYWE